MDTSASNAGNAEEEEPCPECNRDGQLDVNKQHTTTCDNEYCRGRGFVKFKVKTINGEQIRYRLTAPRKEYGVLRVSLFDRSVISIDDYLNILETERYGALTSLVTDQRYNKHRLARLGGEHSTTMTAEWWEHVVDKGLQEMTETPSRLYSFFKAKLTERFAKVASFEGCHCFIDDCASNMTKDYRSYVKCTTCDWQGPCGEARPQDGKLYCPKKCDNPDPVVRQDNMDPQAFWDTSDVKNLEKHQKDRHRRDVGDEKKNEEHTSMQPVSQATEKKAIVVDLQEKA